MRNSMIDQASERGREAIAAATRRGASAARFSFSQSQSAGCAFESGRLKNTDTKQGVAVSLEVVVDRKQGRGRCNSLEDVDEMLGRAFDLARAGSAVHFDAYPPPGPVTEVKTFSETTAALPRQSMIDSCQQIADDLKREDPEIYIVASANRSESEGVLVTSGGVCHTRRRTRWHLDGGMQRVDGTDMLFSGFGRGWRDVNEFYNPDLISEHVCEDLRIGKTIAPAPAGSTTVLLTPELFRMLLSVLAMGTNGRNVAKGDSPLRDRLGQRIFDPCLTIVDDPHRDFCPKAETISGDGLPTRPTTIIRDGVLETFLYDLDSAALAGAEPTGHDGCSPYSPDVAAGDIPSEDLLAGIDDGLFVKHLIGFGQGNVINGDFSANVMLGYRIRDGRIVGRVKDTMIAGNIYENLTRNVRLSSNKDPIHRAPYAAIDGVQCSAAG